MPIHLKVETELDESSARAAADAVQSHFRNASRSIGSELSQGLKAGIDDAVRGASGSFGAFSSQAESVFGKMSSGAGLAGLGVAGIGAAAIGVGAELYNLGSQWDSITDSITGKTGIVGGELDKITESIKNVGVNSSASLTEIGDVTGNLVQSLQLTGRPLEDLTARITDLDELTGDKLNVRDLGKVFRGFGVEADNAGPALDRLYDTFTNTGIPVSELISSLKQVGPVARTMGLDIGTTAGLLTTLEEAGLNGETAFKGLQIAMGNLAKKEPGKDPQQAIRDVVTEIQGLINKSDETGAIDLAKSTFGKSWGPIFDAIKNGKLNVDDLNKALGDTGHTIEGSKKATDDWAEEFKKLKNSLIVELEPAAKFVFGGISNMITQYLINPFHELNDLVKGTAGLWHSLFGGGDGGGGGTPSAPGVPPTLGAGPGPAVGPPGAIQGPGIARPPGGPGAYTPGSGLFPGTAAPAGAGAEAWRPQVRAALQQYGAQYGITNTQAWEDAMVRQIATESGGNPGAINRTDSNAAAGHPSQGLAQFIPSTFASNNITGGSYLDPTAQIAAMIPYVSRTYGMNAAGGPNMIGQGHGYDQGGILPPGPTLAVNNTGQPEAVMNPQQTQMLGALFGGLQQGGGIGGIIGGFGNMAMNAAQAGGGPNSVQPGAQPSSRSPGGGSSSGGLAAAAAGSAMDAFAPGSSALLQLATRAIKYGGQAISIGIMGGLETFLPGGTALSDPSKSLVGRVASGIAGGQPASQNMAGAAKPPQAPPPLGSAASGRGSGPPPGPPGPVNNGVHIDTMVVQNGDGEAAARDLNRAYHSQAAGDNSR